VQERMGHPHVERAYVRTRWPVTQVRRVATARRWRC
jgi:hypothetical protein